MHRRQDVVLAAGSVGEGREARGGHRPLRRQARQGRPSPSTWASALGLRPAPAETQISATWRRSCPSTVLLLPRLAARRTCTGCTSSSSFARRASWCSTTSTSSPTTGLCRRWRRSTTYLELLETLDGVSPDADPLFVLGDEPGRYPPTCRSPVLVRVVSTRWPRSAARRYDCRRRLFDLYSKSMNLEIIEDEIAVIIKRTSGVTGSFFKGCTAGPRSTRSTPTPGLEVDAASSPSPTTGSCRRSTRCSIPGNLLPLSCWFSRSAHHARRRRERTGCLIADSAPRKGI